MDAMTENGGKILLHACCGPCASACVERLREEGREPTIFFSNANIAPAEEYALRRDTARHLAESMGAAFVEDEGVTHDEWLEQVARGYEDAPEGGERCRRCFAFNLARAARFAAANGFPEFTTSLTVSPHKRSATVFVAGQAAEGQLDGARFAPFDFKKHDGFKRSVALAQAFGLYRQDYCGCEFSRRSAARPAGAPVLPSVASRPVGAPVLPSVASRPVGAPVASSVASRPAGAPVASSVASRPVGADLQSAPARGAGREAPPSPALSFHEHFMRLALEEARLAHDEAEVPAGCVIVRRPADFAADPASCEVLARAHNVTERAGDPTAHAEIRAISAAAAAIGDFRLTDTILYVTKEPCAMCAGAIVLARIPLVVWGMSDPKRGGQSAFGILSSEALIHRAEIVEGVLGEESRRLVQDFFRARRHAAGD